MDVRGAQTFSKKFTVETPVRSLEAESGVARNVLDSWVKSENDFDREVMARSKSETHPQGGMNSVQDL